jgi:CubicO group peptidase (beta-lactamase class C family)
VPRTSPRNALLLLALVLAGSVSRPAATAFSTATLDQQLEGALRRTRVPGAVVIATDRRHVFYERALGLAEAAAGRTMTMDAMFRLASMTKPITSVAAMQLVEQGRVALDDPAGKYVPELATVPMFTSFNRDTGAYTVAQPKKPITIRQLFTHTSGLAYGWVNPLIRDFKPHAGEQYVDGPLVFEPGSAWHYGTSTDWIGRVVERVSGQTLEAYFQEHIFAPLKMVDTSYGVVSEKQPRVVNVHQHQPDGSFIEQPRRAVQAPANPIGGGGLVSTGRDYIRFLQMLLNDGALDGERIVAPATVQAMSVNQIGAVGVRALRTAQPERSADLSFIADRRDKWGLGFLITTDRVAGKRSPGSLSWGGIDNTYFWIDRSQGVAGVILMQFLPFADPAALDVYNVFERGVYQLVSSGLSRPHS